MNYEIESVDLTVNIAGEANISANIVGAQPLAITVGKSAEIDAGQAVTYIESGKAEVQTAVAAGIAEIQEAAENMANKDLSNLTAIGEARFSEKQDVISDLATIRNGATAGATAVQPASLATVATSGKYTDLSNKPSLATVATSGSYNDLSNKPNLATVATSGKYTDLSNKPSLATVATSGSYNDLSNKPSLSGYAADNAVVHLTGTETINGDKTFGNTPYVTKSGAGVSLKNTSQTKGTAPVSETWGGIAWEDVNGNTMGRVRQRYNTSKVNYVEFIVYKANTASDSSSAVMHLVYPTSGDAYADTPQLQPNGDNNRNLGTSSYRWKQLYAGTTTIATSDERLKQGIENVPDEVLDAWGEVGFCRYKFNDAVAQKGINNARYHIGLVAQQIKRIFTVHGLNAFAYGLICYDEWDGGDRYALRYEECLCLEAAYQRRRADRIEARLAALEARV